MANNVSLCIESSANPPGYIELFQLVVAEALRPSEYQLVLTQTQLELRAPESKKLKPLSVDFLSGAVAHRHRFGGGKGQLIAKAVGVSRKDNLRVLDVTAGLGRDAFVLASLGCDVMMLERSNVIAALLEDGLQRARREAGFADFKLALIHCDALSYLQQIGDEVRPDVVYMDPMFPEAKKSALVKKEMRMLRHVVGEDLDAPVLLSKALQVAKKRVVVKRARHAPVVEGSSPDLVFDGKSSRYDVYLSVEG